MKSKRIIFCMTSDWNFDQRMQRITSLLSQNYDCQIIHRSGSQNTDISTKDIRSICCFFKSGALFYAEFNIRLFLILLFEKTDLLYAVDTDTLLAVGLVSKLKRVRYVYDSHEWFSEVPELENKNGVKKIWNTIENCFVPGASLCLTVNESLGKIFQEKWNTQFHAILNAPAHAADEIDSPDQKTILYQGALNKGRGLECAIMAMESLEDYTLLLAGDGDIKSHLEAMVSGLVWRNRILFLGKLSPSDLKAITKKASFGLNLLDGKSKSYYYSLANKFFDYWQAGVPSINMNFPEYRKMIDQYGVGITLTELNAVELANQIKNYEITAEYEKLKGNCGRYRNTITWENEQKKLLPLIGGLFT